MPRAILVEGAVALIVCSSDRWYDGACVHFPIQSFGKQARLTTKKHFVVFVKVFASNGLLLMVRFNDKYTQRWCHISPARHDMCRTWTNSLSQRSLGRDDRSRDTRGTAEPELLQHSCDRPLPWCDNDFMNKICLFFKHLRRRKSVRISSCDDWT